jgi:hypothetical protein
LELEAFLRALSIQISPNSRAINAHQKTDKIFQGLTDVPTYRELSVIIQIYEQLSFVNLIFRMKAVDKQELVNQSSLFLGCFEKLPRVYLVLREVLYKRMSLIKYL